MILQKNKKFWKAIILNLVMSVIHNGAFSTAVSAGSGSKWLNFTDFFSSELPRGNSDKLF